MQIQRLELTWLGKNNPPSVEPRILIHDSTKDYGDRASDNMLIHGDNLLALKSLEQDFAGRVKCIYIDPPYNTGSAFEHYDDNLEHSIWLNLMASRLIIMRRLLKDDGSIWISIDDDEQAYLKVLCDEVFGRRNFVCNVIWEKKFSPQNDTKWLSDSHDFIMVYAKNKNIWRPNLLPRTEEMNAHYKNPDNDPRGLWKPTDFSARTYSKSGDYPITLPSGRIVNPPASRAWITNQQRFHEMLADNLIWFGKDGNSMPRKKTFLSEVRQGLVCKTVWRFDEVGDNKNAKQEVKAFNSESVFATPKPERLIERVLTLATNPSDIVLDSFLGSGTTAAVAHKMSRRWIGIELADTCYSHCLPRLRKVVDGEQGGISKAVGWNGGGGFKFYELAPSLLIKDKYGTEIINPAYSPEMVAAAVAKHNGFKYAPDRDVFWKQGRAHEHSYIYTTTNYLTTEAIDYIAADMRHNETLLICAKAFDIGLGSRHERITVRKIPQSLSRRYEYDVNCYDFIGSEQL